jgi:hypothetical protein
VLGEGALAKLRVAGTVSEPRSGRRPSLAVAVGALRAQVRAQGDQLRQLAHGVDVARGGDPHEPVRVQVVAEEERGVGVARREQARAAVVGEVALVDGLEAERVRLRAERGEDGDGLALALGPQRVAPERALCGRLAGDRLPDLRSSSQNVASSPGLDGWWLARTQGAVVSNEIRARLRTPPGAAQRASAAQASF